MNDKKSISAKDVFSAVQPFVKKKKVLPFVIFGVDLLIFLLLFYLILTTESLLLKIAYGIIEGFMIGFLFIVGHDCCHNSYTASKKANSWIGKIAFLPALHNFSLWDVLHNKVHHGYTNLKSKDFVYTPLSPEEYLSLSTFEKMKYKMYRSSFGHLPYYLFEIWWKKMIIPNSSIPYVESSKKHWLNAVPLLLYILGVFCISIWISIVVNQNIFLNILMAMIIPFLVWNWMIGFVTYQHHTNSLTRWFVKEEEWHYWEAQIENSPHIVFPKPINQIFHNIMEHTAHHSNMDIPLYNLGKAQTEIEKKFNEKVIVIQWSWGFYMNSVNSCKLYDYDTHQWYSFSQAEGLLKPSI